MADRGPHLGLVRVLLLLTVAWLAAVGAESYQKFLGEHVDYPVTQVPNGQYYCELMMQRRKLATLRYCKHLNTFVHVDPALIRAVCGQAGDPTTGDLRESHASFPLTVCRLQKGSWAPDCRYQGSSGVERIVIACEQGYPVHLQTEVPDN